MRRRTSKPMFERACNAVVGAILKLAGGFAAVLIGVIVLSSLEVNVSANTKRYEVKQAVKSVKGYAEKAYDTYKLVKNFI